MRYKLLITLLIIAVGYKANAQTVVKFNDANIRYMGRISMRDSTAELSWPGNSVTVNFTGTALKAVLKDERAENYYDVIVDGKVASVLHPEKDKKTYTLASGLPAGKHTLELFKRTEWTMGKTWFYGFEIDGKVLSPSPAKKHKIEFYGNSITCGMADEDTSGKDRGTGPYENGYMSYAAITARHLDAEFYSMSRSGIGVTVSWFPMIMSEMYYRQDPTDSTSQWDFKKYTPDLVVINLFQNDSWITNIPDNPQFKARFGNTKPTPEFIINAYASLLKSIRGKYPKAKILCILGSMDATKAGSAWPGYIDKAVAGMNDKNIYTHFIPYKNTPGHPSVKEQQAMADDLIGYIEGAIKW